VCARHAAELDAQRYCRKFSPRNPRSRGCFYELFINFLPKI